MYGCFVRGGGFGEEQNKELTEACLPQGNNLSVAVFLDEETACQESSAYFLCRSAARVNASVIS
jgi:hypothetical protein